MGQKHTTTPIKVKEPKKSQDKDGKKSTTEKKNLFHGFSDLRPDPIAREESGADHIGG